MLDYFNNSEKLLKKGPIIIFILAFIYFIYFAFLADYQSYTQASIYLVSFSSLALYLKYINTKSGRENFKILNYIIGICITISAIYIVVASIENIDFSISKEYSFVLLFSMLATVALTIYFILTFLFNKFGRTIISNSSRNSMFFYTVLGLYTLSLFGLTIIKFNNADNSEIVLLIFNFCFLLFAEATYTRYIYLYNEHKLNNVLKVCASCGYEYKDVDKCPECGNTEIKKKNVSEIFAKIDAVEQKKERKACSAFQVDNIPNNLIGKKIKTYARVILKISVVILFLGFASTFIYAGIVADEESSFLVYLMVLVVTNIIIVLTFVFSYFSFLLVSGFGAIIEDINAIKNK